MHTTESSRESFRRPQIVTAQDGYDLYRALHAHFNTTTYDFVKWNGQIKNRSLSDRDVDFHDRHCFEKLARLPRVISFNRMLANFVADPQANIRHIISEEGERIYTEWAAFNESLSYLFSEQLLEIGDLKQAVGTNGNNHPRLLRLLRQKKIRPETVIILDDVIKFTPRWNKLLTDDLIWVKTRFHLWKYSRLLPFDHDKFSKIIVDYCVEINDK